MNNLKKPPLGLRPRWLLEERRRDEIRAAFYRYIVEDYPIPLEWIEEYNEIIEWLNARQSNNNETRR